MEKRIFTAIVISIAFLWIWAAIAPRIFPELAKPKPVAVKPAVPSRVVPASGRPVPPTPKAAETAAHVIIAPASADEVVVSKIERDDFTATFSNRGAELISFTLNKYKDKSGRPVELVKARPPSRSDFPFAIETQSAAVTERLNTALYAINTHEERGVTVVEYKFAGDGVSATKTFRIGSDYQFDFSVVVAPVVPYRVIIGPGLRTLAPEERDNRIVVTGNGVVQREGSFDVLSREKGDRLRIFDRVDFIGIEDNYFLSVLRPAKGGGGILRRVELPNGGQEVRKELYAGVNAAPDGTVSGSAFFGPKETKLLDRFGLASALQFGMFGIIARFLLEVLVWINRATKNYGFAIIVLTIIIKIVL